MRKRHITQRQAAAELKVSERWVKKLLERMRSVGDRAVVHGLKGKSSNRRASADLQAAATDLIRKHYRDYGPTQATEVLASEHGMGVSRETVRKWMIAARLWRPKKAKLERVHG